MPEHEPEADALPTRADMALAQPAHAPRKSPPTLLPLAPLERRTLTALKRGQQSLEAVLDLHGLRQAEAHDRLRGFLLREQARGARLVLVITGKGAAGDTIMGDERGVLKRIVPHWLRMADLRPIVMGFDDAALNHGGSGALYIRLRRLREHKS
ncbi:MAG: Smr/MutS family protein [Bosea sp. (in: a-proteobacteria)]